MGSVEICVSKYARNLSEARYPRYVSHNLIIQGNYFVVKKKNKLNTKSEQLLYFMALCFCSQTASKYILFSIFIVVGVFLNLEITVC